jgi:hypothetical protein
LINSDAGAVNQFYENKAYLYPNPSEGVFRIYGDSEVQEIIVFDVSGRMIKVEVDVASRLISINQKGMFIVQIKTKDSVSTQKILSR